MARAEPILRRSWFLGSLVAIASWNVVFVTPAPGTDGSWVIGLYMAAQHGLDFGDQLVFTYGPLGFLAPLSPTYGGVAVTAYDGLAQLAFLYGAAIHLLLCVSLVWALRRSVGAPIAVLLVFLLVAGFTGIQRPYVLAAVWCLALLSETSPPPARQVVIFGGAGLAAIETLIRVTTGSTILAMCVIVLAVQESRRRDLSQFLGIYAGLLAALWFAAGQGVANVPDYLESMSQVISGYSQAMPFRQDGIEWDLAVLAGVLGIVLLVAGGYLSTSGRRRRIAAALVMGLAAFSLFKEGVVREDASHLGVLFASLLGLALAIPPRPAWRLPATGAVTALAVIAFLAPSPSPGAQDFDPVDHADSFVTEVRTLASSDRRDELRDFGRDFITRFAQLDPETVRLLSGRPVASDPSGAAVIWAYGLSWRPLPVFQANLAYTTDLDQRNADALDSFPPSGRVLRGTAGAIDPFTRTVIDDRYPAWNPPAAAISLLCRFQPLHTTPDWQVLRRRGNRCGEPRPIGSVETAYGEQVDVPAAGENEAVFARIHGAGVSGLERLRALVFRARFRRAVVNGGATYRLVPGTATDGLIMKVPPALDLPAPFSLSPGARTLELTGTSGDLRFDFYALPLRRTFTG